MRPSAIPQTLAAMLTLTAVAACATVAAPPPVPPAVVEVVPKPPVSGQVEVWRPGYYNWNGSGYVWTSGAWIPQSEAGHDWYPGAWVRGPGGGYVWQPAHWAS